MKPAKKLTLSAILTALCVVVLFAGSFVPNFQISLVALAAIFPAVSVLHCGCFWAAAVYAVSGGLAFLLLPDKSCAIWFLVVFGHCGITKSLTERCGNRVIEWLLKILLFGACIAVMYLFLRTFFFAILPEQSLWLLLAGLLICFILYDVAFSALISFYCRRVKPHVE